MSVDAKVGDSIDEADEHATRRAADTETTAWRLIVMECQIACGCGLRAGLRALAYAVNELAPVTTRDTFASMADFGTMSVAVFRALLAALAAAGVDADALLHELGVSYETLQQPESRIPTDLAFRVFADAPRLTGDPNFGLHVGANVPLGTFEVLDHATRTSRTVGEALERTVRFFALLIERVEMTLEVRGSVARIIHRVPPPLVSPRAAVEMLFAIIVARGETLTGETWPIHRVQFAHEAPASTAELERFFHAPVQFGHSHDELVFDREWLERPFLTADEGVADVLDRFATTLLAKLAPDHDFLSGVKRSIAETLKGTSPSLKTSARRLGLSARTLQRKLSETGTSYQAVVEEVRRELAGHYLADATLTVQEVGYLLGFSEPSAFHRAFRRWEARTPSEYRNQIFAVPPSAPRQT